MDTKIVRITDKEQLKDEELLEAARILREGGLVAFPTETVYGLGGNALDEHDPCDAVRELIERKYLRYTGDRKGRQKIIAALIRLGHRYGDIRTVLEEYPLEEEQSEEESYF